MESLEDLYTLDAEIRISIEDDGKITGHEEYRVSINDVVNGSTETASGMIKEDLLLKRPTI